MVPGTVLALLKVSHRPLRRGACFGRDLPIVMGFKWSWVVNPGPTEPTYLVTLAP